MVFRSLLRNWLQTTARQRVRERVSEEARRRLATELGETPAADQPPLACDIGVVFALGIEAGGLEDLLEDVVSIRGHGFTAKRGTVANRHVTLIVSGSGHEAAAQATEALLDGHDPDWVIAAGFAGGLQPQLARHDMLMADSLIGPRGGQLTVQLRVDPAALEETPGVHVGRLLSADQIATDPGAKAELGRQYDAMAVDLESYAVAEVCSNRGTRFIAVRTISDPVDEQLPDDVRKLSAPKSELRRWGAALGTAWRRPASLKDMMRLKENALVGSDRLAKFLVGVIEQLPCQPDDPGQSAGCE